MLDSVALVVWYFVARVTQRKNLFGGVSKKRSILVVFLQKVTPSFFGLRPSLPIQLPAGLLALM